MKAVILAAGEGSRMRPLTHTRPKVMLPLANRPILEHLLVQTAEAGISEFVLVVGYHDEQVRRYFGNGDNWGVSIEYCTQRRQMGTADGLRMVEDLISGDFLVMNGDIIVNREDIKRLSEGSGNILSVTRVEDTQDLGVVAVEDGQVTHIYEKTVGSASPVINAGLYRFTRDIFKALARTAESPRGEYELTDSLQLMIDEGRPVAAWEIGYWLNLSYPWDLLVANQSLLAEVKEQNLGTLEENVTLRGVVSIGRGTTVMSGSYIAGPVIIGEDCTIGPNCYLRPNTSIGDKCHVGSATEIKGSVVMRGSKIPHQNYVGDSVIGEDCNLGAGAKIANLRLDGQDVVMAGRNTKRRKLGAIIGDGVEVGINTSINVGSVIGSNTQIGPGAVVSGFISPDSRIF